MRDDALPVGRLLRAAAAIVLAVVVAIGVVFAILAHRHVPPGGVAVAPPAPLDAGLPMLQSAPQRDLAAYKAEKQQALDGVGWVDATRGVAHVPIATAMALVAARAPSAAGSR